MTLHHLRGAERLGTIDVCILCRAHSQRWRASRVCRSVYNEPRSTQALCEPDRPSLDHRTDDHIAHDSLTQIGVTQIGATNLERQLRTGLGYASRNGFTTPKQEAQS